MKNERPLVLVGNKTGKKNEKPEYIIVSQEKQIELLKNNNKK